MANLEQTYDVNSIPEPDDFTPIQPGSYTGMIVNSEMKATNNGAGKYLNLEIVIQGGEYNGRKMFERLNLVNSNQTAVDIAVKTLGAIARAVGLATVSDSLQLHNKRFVMDVEIEAPKPYTKDGVDYPGKPQNKIKKYHAVGLASTPSPTAQTQAAAAPSVAPWKQAS